MDEAGAARLVRPLRQYIAAVCALDIVVTLALFLWSGNAPPSTVTFWREQVLDYTFSNSYFDVLMVSALRTFLLVLVYSGCRVQHWFLVAITTGGSLAFCIVKFVFVVQVSQYWVRLVLLIFTLAISCLETFVWLGKHVSPELLRKEVESADNDHRPLLNERPVERQRMIVSTNSDIPREDFTQYGSYASSYLSSQHGFLESGYSAAVEEAMKMVREDCLDTTWDFVLEQDGITIYSTPTAGSVAKVKGVTIMPFSATQVLEYCLDIESQPLWNTPFEDFDLVEQVSDRLAVIHCNFAAPWPVTPRDFVFARGWKTEESGSTLIASTSIIRPDVPEQQGHVRGQLISCGFLIEPLGGSADGTDASCMVIHVTNLNLLGWLPPKSMNKTIMHQPLCLLALRSQLETLHGG